MMEKKIALRPRAAALAVALALGLSACGGGGGGGGSNVRPSSPPPVDPGSSEPTDPDVTYDSSDDATWPRNLDGTGGLIKSGAGTLILTGANSYTGGTSISEGTLQIGDGGTTGSIVGDVKDDGALVFDRSDQLIFGGAISGRGSLEQAGEGRLILTGTNTYTGGTTISRGTLQIGNGDTTGSITGDITDNGSLVFDRGDEETFAGVISGSGSLEQAGKGRLILTADSTYTGGTTISRGTLQLGNGGTSGWITGDVTDNGTLVFDHDDDVTFAGTISGSGSLEQAGKGRLILTADNTYTGGTTIHEGTLQVGAGGAGGFSGSIVGDVLNNGALVFDPFFVVTFGGKISGSGSLQKIGTGALVLTGDSTYTGGTTISSGSLVLGSYGTTGWIAGDVVDNGTLEFERRDDVTFDGVVSGSGALVQGGYGTLTLTAASTYTGGTRIASGVLEIPAGARPGTAGITIDGGTLRIPSGSSLSNTVTLNFGMLDNAGTLANATGETPVHFDQGGARLLNHDGGVIEGSTVAVESGGFHTVINDGVGSTIRSTNGIAIKMEDGGEIVNSGGGMIVGDATAIYLNGGTVTNTQGSTIKATAPDGDSIAVDTSSDEPLSFMLNNSGTIIGNVNARGGSGGANLSAGGVIRGNLDLGGGELTLSGDAGTTQRVSRAVTGATTFGSSLTKSGEGTWIIDTDDFVMTSDGTYATWIQGGTLQVGDGGTVGMIGQGGIEILGEGRLVFDRSDDVTFAGQISSTFEGAGVLEHAGTGTLTLTSDIDTDIIRIDRGTLQVGNGGAGPSLIRSDIVNNGSLVIDTSGNLFVLSISGSGSLTVAGTGTLFLGARNPGGVKSTYTGGTSVENGILQAGQPIPGNVAIGMSGTLDGVPQVTGDLSSAGKVAVHGNDITVGGNYIQASTGTLAVSLGSKLDVAGAATLNGGTLEITGADSGYVSNTHTDVLTAAGGVGGTFDRLVKDSGVVFTATTINYDGNSVWLDTTGLDVTTAAAGAGVSYTPASMASAVRVQGTFEQLDEKIAAGSLSEVSGEFLRSAGQFQQAPTLQAAQASLRSLSGELHAVSAAMTFEAIDASSRALSDRFDNLLCKGTGVGMWTHDLSLGGGMARAGFDDVDFQVDGWLVGSDRSLGSSGVAGFAFGQSHGQQRLNHGFDRNASRNTEAMLYAGRLDGSAYVQGRVGFGRFQQNVNRRVLLGYSAQAVGTRYDGRYSTAYGESGLHFGGAGSYLTPFVDVQYARVDRDGFVEQGAGGFGLRSNARGLDRWQAGLGLRARRHWDLGHGRAVDVSARGQWQRTLASHGGMFDASFVGLEQWQPLLGIGLSRYSSVFGIGLDAQLSRHAALNFSYDYERGQHDTAQALSARLNIAF